MESQEAILQMQIQYSHINASTWLNNKQQCDLRPSCARYSPCTSNPQDAFFAFVPLLPPSDSITQIPMSAGQWKHQQKVERKRGLRIFHSGFLSTLIDLPMAEFLNWNQHLSASPLSLPQLHLPFSSSSYGPLIYECLGVFISHVGISDLVVTTVCSSFSKSSSFWQSWRQIMQYYMW